MNLKYNNHEKSGQANVYFTGDSNIRILIMSNHTNFSRAFQIIFMSMRNKKQQ